MPVPDLATTPDTAGQSSSGLRYHIHGTVQQTAIIELNPGQTVYSDAGGMSWMSQTIDMNTHSGGGLGGMVKRAFSGATLFLIDFTAVGGAGYVGFARDSPGKILAFDLNARECRSQPRGAFVRAGTT